MDIDSEVSWTPPLEEPSRLPTAFVSAGITLGSLKAEYLALEETLCVTRNEVYWQQGRILIQIKEQLRHGQWLPYVKTNLNIERSQAAARMTIGTLAYIPTLPGNPKLPGNRQFNLEDLAEVATLATKHKLTPDAAAERWVEENEVIKRGSRRIRYFDNILPDSFDLPAGIDPKAWSDSYQTEQHLRRIVEFLHIIDWPAMVGGGTPELQKAYRVHSKALQEISSEFHDVVWSVHHGEKL